MRLICAICNCSIESMLTHVLFTHFNRITILWEDKKHLYLCFSLSETNIKDITIPKERMRAWRRGRQPVHKAVSPTAQTCHTGTGEHCCTQSRRLASCCGFSLSKVSAQQRQRMNAIVGFRIWWCQQRTVQSFLDLKLNVYYSDYSNYNDQFYNYYPMYDYAKMIENSRHIHIICIHQVNNRLLIEINNANLYQRICLILSSVYSSSLSLA